MDDLETHQLKSDYNRLIKALPPLPTPNSLYAKIVHCCRQLRTTTRSMVHLEEHLRAARLSQANWRERWDAIQLVLMTTEKLKLEFVLIRTQLGTLLALPPLMTATRIMHSSVWTAMMSSPQLDDEDEPLLMDFPKIEEIITEQLEILEGYRKNANELRDALIEEKRRADLAFQDQVLQKLDELFIELSHERGRRTNSVISRDESTQSDFVMLLATNDTGAAEGADRLAHNRSAQGEDAMRHEQKVISENSEFLERVGEDAADVDTTEPSDHPVTVAGDEHHGTADQVAEPPRKAMEEKGDDEEEEVVANDFVIVDEAEGDNDDADMEEVEGDNVDADMEEVEGHIDDADTEEVEIQEAVIVEKLQQELRRTRQERNDLRMMIAELEKERICAPRRFHNGRIWKPEESEMPCAFCSMAGHHYSDSCAEFMNVSSRIEILRRKGKCLLCLDTYCRGGRMCRKRGTSCHHCGSVAHNSAICDLPERSMRIIDRKTALMRRYDETCNRIHRLIRRLRRYESDQH